MYLCVSDLKLYCQSLSCDDDCEVVQGYDARAQQTVFKAYCVCNVGYTRVRVIEGFSCSCQLHFLPLCLSVCLSVCLWLSVCLYPYAQSINSFEYKTASLVTGLDEKASRILRLSPGTFDVLIFLGFCSECNCGLAATHIVPVDIQSDCRQSKNVNVHCKCILDLVTPSKYNAAKHLALPETQRIWSKVL